MFWVRKRNVSLGRFFYAHKTYTVKPAVAATSIKRDPPLSGHFRAPPERF